jgi:hypothetical protein
LRRQRGSTPCALSMLGTLRAEPEKRSLTNIERGAFCDKWKNLTGIIVSACFAERFNGHYCFRARRFC